MARAALSPEDIADFREVLTRAATRLFAAHGYEGVTLRALADALGCSPMKPYRYVADKAELFALVRTDAFRRFADRQEAAAAGGGAVVERLLRLKEAYIAFALASPDAYRIMFELRQPQLGTYPALAAESRRAFGPLHRAVVEAVATGVLAGEPLHLAHLLWAHTHGLVSLHLAGQLVMGKSLEALASGAIGPTGLPTSRASSEKTRASARPEPAQRRKRKQEQKQKRSRG